MSARFENVPVVEVSAENFAELWPFMVRAINKSSFVALDTEMSGIGERKNLMTQFVEDRYKYMCEVARSRAILSLGISCFKLKKRKMSNETECKESDTKLNFRIKTFNIVVLCTENFVVEPVSLTFLVGHGFDFNKQYAKGVLYSRGDDKVISGTPQYSVRNLFNQLILANKPVVVHNGFLDLVFLYENFYCKLPDKLQVFTADLTEMFPAGVFDTKFVSEYSVREPASFLLYVFKKWGDLIVQEEALLYAHKLATGVLKVTMHHGLSDPQKELLCYIKQSRDEFAFLDCAKEIRLFLEGQRTNIRHQKLGRKHVCLKFREEASFSCFTEHIYCGARDENEAVDTDVTVCEKFAAYGFCPREKSCQFSHNVDDVLDREWKVKEAKRLKRKRKRHNSGNNEHDATKTRGTENSPPTDTSEGVGARDKQDTHMTYPRDAHVSQSNGVKTRDCGHRAGFDAFMTGYCMATYLLQLGKDSVDNELTLPSLVDVSNKLSLPRKDVPLQITRSHFIRPSTSHTEKLKRLKNQLQSSEQS